MKEWLTAIIVRATAIAGQESLSREFKLVNRGIDFKNFRLEEIAN